MEPLGGGVLFGTLATVHVVPASVDTAMPCVPSAPEGQL